MSKTQKRLKQISIKESFSLSKKSKIATSIMEKNLRDLMAAAAEKRLAATKPENVTNTSCTQNSNKNLGCNRSLAAFESGSKSPKTVDSDESCLPSSADLFPSSSEFVLNSPEIEQCSSNETMYTNIIESSPCTSRNSELFLENNIHEVDSQPHSNSADEELQMSFLNRIPECSIPLPKMEPLENHSIMFSPYIRPGDAPRPYPPTYRDNWDSDHVRMPCSPQNLYPVENLNGEKQIKSRWDLICQSLRRNILSSHDLEAAILQYNSQYRGKWNFNGLHTFFNTCFTEHEKCHFFEEILPKMINMALNLPNICTQSIPMLKKDKDHYLTMSQKQIGCLMLNAFFCTFPRRTIQSRKFRRVVEYPDINFNGLFYGVKNKTSTRTEKLKCLLNYFRRITSKEPSGTVTFHRQFLQELPKWGESRKGIRTAVIKHDGVIETEGYGMLQVDFANKYVGGGVLGGGCVQEEIRFVICPELIISRLFTERLGPTEVLIVTGVEQYNKYSGYSDTFKWEGNFEDQTPRDVWGRRSTELVAMDAISFRNTADQFKLPSVERELNKAYCGFYEEALPPNSSAVATGNWGCGAFKGDPNLKFIIQLMAASQAGRDLVYFTFNSVHLKKELRDIYNLIIEKNLAVGDVWRILVNYSNIVQNGNEAHPKLHGFLNLIFSNSEQVEDASQNRLAPEITDSDKNAIQKLIEAVYDSSSTDIEDNDPG
ncbi:poly(ADP-ribose) glycohydrolase [Nephila pilipes]|uniref:poly(ADP-ribose) glycohydrolase n=1 Tax=Nephila pilipes TaxID=299642 RepID=A0A8X6Q2P9_NEPPI|nr:poly(ADP-ribose) glycohydrolase [Nephila pilipes]